MAAARVGDISEIASAKSVQFCNGGRKTRFFSGNIRPDKYERGVRLIKSRLNLEQTLINCYLSLYYTLINTGVCKISCEKGITRKELRNKNY